MALSVATNLDRVSCPKAIPIRLQWHWPLRPFRAVVFGNRTHSNAQRRTRKRGDRIDERTAEFAEPEVNAEKPKPKIA